MEVAPGSEACTAESPGKLSSPPSLPPLQNLRREIQVRKPRVDDVLERAASIATIQSPELDPVRALLETLSELWGALQEGAEQRQQLLDATYQVQQFYFDVAEVEAWLNEQELFMMNEEKGKVRSPPSQPAYEGRKGRRGLSGWLRVKPVAGIFSSWGGAGICLPYEELGGPGSNPHTAPA